jgi:hypothetical protein
MLLSCGGTRMCSCVCLQEMHYSQQQEEAVHRYVVLLWQEGCVGGYGLADHCR